MFRHARTMAAVWLAGICASAPLAASDAVPAAAAGVSERGNVPRLIVLRSGKVFEGVIHVARNGYEVESGSGRIYLADSFIWFTAESRQDAYRIIRERIPDATADSHVRIAQWCVENGLHSAARDELGSALRLEPHHTDARSMLRLLDPPPVTNGETAPPRGAELLPGDVTPLGGLRPDEAREFVASVQPILVNRCGNAACHGTTSRNAFTLRTVRSGDPAYRAHTAANLDAVRKQISLDDPERSPLLISPSHPGHGGARKSLFVGAAGKAQLRSLMTWVRSVARESTLSIQIPESTAGVLLTSRVATVSEGEAIGSRANTAAPSNSAAADEAAALLERVVVEDSPDAFDPDEFNRRYGPRADQASEDPLEGPSR